MITKQSPKILCPICKKRKSFSKMGRRRVYENKELGLRAGAQYICLDCIKEHDYLLARGGIKNGKSVGRFR